MKPKKLGLGDKATITGDPQDLGLNSREGYKHETALRPETGSSQPKEKKGTMSSDRGSFPTRNG
jgi:hypothetical protein